MRTSPSLPDQLAQVPPEVRGLVEAAVETARSAAPDAEEVVYNSSRPGTPSMMWKLVRYRVNGANVAGVGCFTKHAAVFLYRGRELDDPARLLQGTGKDSRFIPLRSVEDATRPEVRTLLSQAFELEQRT
jgi:hypothetical protein